MTGLVPEVKRFLPFFAVLTSITPFVLFARLLLKIATKGAIPPTLRNTSLYLFTVYVDEDSIHQSLTRAACIHLLQVY